MNDTTSMPSVLKNYKTPEQWVAIFEENGISLSPRSLRESARTLGQYKKCGRAIIMSAEHIDSVFKEGQPCPSKSTSETDNGGSEAGSPEYRPANTTDKALAHLLSAAKPKRKRSSRTSKSAKSNVTTLVTRKA